MHPFVTTKVKREGPRLPSVGPVSTTRCKCINGSTLILLKNTDLSYPYELTRTKITKPTPLGLLPISDSLLNNILNNVIVYFCFLFFNEF